MCTFCKENWFLLLVLAITNQFSNVSLFLFNNEFRCFWFLNRTFFIETDIFSESWIIRTNCIIHFRIFVIHKNGYLIKVILHISILNRRGYLPDKFLLIWFVGKNAYTCVPRALYAYLFIAILIESFTGNLTYSIFIILMKFHQAFFTTLVIYSCKITF